MKKAFSLSFAAIALLLSFASRAQSPNPLYQHLPPNADHITEINFNQLNTKGNFSAILNAIPPTGNAQTNLIIDVLKDPSSAGIDFSNNIFIAQTSASGNDADTLDFTSIIFQLSDSAKFRTLLTRAIPGLQVNAVGGKGISFGKDKMGAAWNDKLVVITSASSDVTPAPNGATPAVATPPVSDIAVEKSIEALAGYSASAWQTDQRFLSGFATDDDVHSWSTGINLRRLFTKLLSKLGKKSGKIPMLPSMPNYSKGPHAAPILSTFNFGNGKIEFHMTLFHQAADADALRALMNRPFNKDLLARVPDGPLLGFAAIHFDPAGIKNILDVYGTRNTVDSVLAKARLSIDELMAPFTGDFLVAALAPQHTSDADTAKKKIQFYFVAAITDPAKLMQLGAKLHSAAPVPDTAKHSPFKNIQKKMVVKDNLLVIANSHEQAEKYFSNQNRRSTDLLGDNNAMQRIVIDLKAVSALVGSSMSNDPKAMVASRILERLDKIVFTNGVMEGDSSSMDLQILTGDPTTNSLTTLMGIMQ